MGQPQLQDAVMTFEAEPFLAEPSENLSALNAYERQMLDWLLNQKMEYIPHPLFQNPMAEQIIFEGPTIAPPDTSWYNTVMEQSPKARPKKTSYAGLSAAEEKKLFLQFNYCRYRLVQIWAAAEANGLDSRSARRMLHWHLRAKAYRDQLAEANLALVLAMAKRTRVSGVDFSDLVSEGNMALMRAVDKFDVARGFKFSTFACRAILKGFSWVGLKLRKYRQMFPVDLDVTIEDCDYQNQRREEHDNSCVEEVRRLIRENRAELSQIEQTVITHRFGLSPKRGADVQPLTLEQVGKLIGVAKGRVRQIQNKALEKISMKLGRDFME